MWKLRSCERTRPPAGRSPLSYARAAGKHGLYGVFICFTDRMSQFLYKSVNMNLDKPRVEYRDSRIKGGLIKSLYNNLTYIRRK